MLTETTYYDNMINIKGGERMKKAFNTSIDEEILHNFKNKCKSQSLPINLVLEKFMFEYTKGKFTFVMEYSDNGK